MEYQKKTIYNIYSYDYYTYFKDNKLFYKMTSDTLVDTCNNLDQVSKYLKVSKSLISEKIKNNKYLKVISKYKNVRIYKVFRLKLNKNDL